MSFVEGLVLIVFILCLSLVVVLLISNRFSHQGKIVVHTDEDGIHYSMEIDGDPYDIQHMRSVTFKVVKKENNAN